MQPDYWLRTDGLQQRQGRLIAVSTERYDGPSDETAAARPTGRTMPEAHAQMHAPTDVAASATAPHEADRGGEMVELREERLRIEKQPEHAGEVRLAKHVTEHTEALDVPVREERVVIERTPGSGQPAGGTQLREGETIDVPVMKERVTVEKEAVVREEVQVRKDMAERIEHIEDTVHREELVVEGDDELVADSADIGPETERQAQSRRP
jgi:uncharacterized protein (TIGR02271 family)